MVHSPDAAFPNLAGDQRVDFDDRAILLGSGGMCPGPVFVQEPRAPSAGRSFFAVEGDPQAPGSTTRTLSETFIACDPELRES